MDWIAQNKESLMKILSDYIIFFPEIERYYLNIEQRKDSDDNELFDFFQNFLKSLTEMDELFNSLIYWVMEEKKLIVDFDESQSRWQYDNLEELEYMFKILIHNFPMVNDLNENLRNNIPTSIFELIFCLGGLFKVKKKLNTY